MDIERIYLSPPHQNGEELASIEKVFLSNWLAPVGSALLQFEQAICEITGFKYAVATSSGTAALHLGLNILGVSPGDQVVSSTMTFIGAVNPIVYQGASPIFIDSQQGSWNIDPELLKNYLSENPEKITAIVPTHLYGMPANVDVLEKIGAEFEIPLLHDLAECIGGKVRGKKIGETVKRGILSFNGNKLITTAGGGAFVTNVKEEAERVLYLATQAKSNVTEYHHESVGYNYRMSNVLAALGLAQTRDFDERVERKRHIFNNYKSELALTGITFQQEPEGFTSDRWLTTLLFDENVKLDVARLVRQMDEANIEVRRLWKPMHLQPIFKQEKVLEGKISAQLFERGLCLPSGCGLTEEQQARVIGSLKAII